MLETVAIGMQRAVIVHTARHICPMPGIYLPVRGLLEIKDVERLGRARDDIRSRFCVLCERETASLEKGRYAA